MSSAAKFAHVVDWDIEFDRPVVDGKVQDPVTGEIREAGRQGLRDGPPSIELRLFNTNADIDVVSITKSIPVRLEKLYLWVAKQVHDGIFSLVSINASEYSFTLVCHIQVSAEEFKTAFQNMFRKKGDFLYTDEEWDDYLQKTYGKYVGKSNPKAATTETWRYESTSHNRRGHPVSNMYK